jgi:hypothetical protein
VRLIRAASAFTRFCARCHSASPTIRRCGKARLGVDGHSATFDRTEVQLLKIADAQYA